jgi:hypothetical protein
MLYRVHPTWVGFELTFLVNKTDCHDIAEILLKAALNTIILTLTLYLDIFFVPALLYQQMDLVLLRII